MDLSPCLSRGSCRTASGWSERVLDEIYESGFVRTLMLRLDRREPSAERIEPYAPGTLNYLNVISGKLRTGPISDPVELTAGDFVRFPGDIPHQLVCLSDKVVAHLVTTLPQSRQFRPTALRPPTSSS